MGEFRLFDLNEAQHEAVVTTDGPLLILAGAGTGKTRVITARAAYLVHQGTAPAQILAVTFTNKAANEMRGRLRSMIDPAAAKKVAMSTFHSLCVRILRQGIERLGYKKNFSIYAESDQLGLIRKIITRTAAKDEKLDPHLAKNLISKAKNYGWAAPEDEESLAGAVFARYQQELKNLNAVDFDDLLLLTVKLFNEHADVRGQWQERFRYLMVDEFQDTNRLQLELISLLAGPNPNVCVVGDDDQSIYGWRGAEVSNILEFEHHFPNPKIVKLEQNYRSTNGILGTANSLIRNNPRRRAKKLWSSQESGGRVRIVRAPDDREEAQWVAQEIHRRQGETGEPWEAFAVLYRMNSQSRLIEENMRHLRIPYRIVGGKSFFDRREVKDLLAYATALINPDDDVSLLRIINTPARGISPGSLSSVLEFSIQQGCSLHKALKMEEAIRGLVSARAMQGIGRFVSVLDTYESRLLEPLADHAKVMEDLIEETGYREELRRVAKTPDEALGRLGNIDDMLRDLADYQKRSDGGLQGFLDELSLNHEREEEEPEKGSGVMLITLHAAKGLEFPHIYLVGLEEGILPHSRSKTEGTVDEERRLLYVGITRAMRSLTLSWCLQRLKFGSVMPCHPSSFIKELDPALVEQIDLKAMLNAPLEDASVKSRFASLREALKRTAEGSEADF